MKTPKIKKDTMFKMRINSDKKQDIKNWIKEHGDKDNIKNMSEFLDLAIDVILEGRFFDK